MLTILAILGYLLLAVLAMALLLIALLLWSPVEFAGHGSVLIEPSEDDDWDPGLPSIDDADPTGQTGAGTATEWPVAFDGEVHGEVRLLWGALALSEQGIRLLWWRRPLTASGDGIPSRLRWPRRAQQAAPTEQTERESDPQARHKRARRRFGRMQAGKLTLADVRRLLPDVRRSLARSWQALRLRLRADVTLGLADPATTGMLAGAIPAAGYLLTASTNAHRPGSVIYNFSPVFDREVLAADFALSGRTTIGSIGWPWLRLALRRDVRRFWWPIRRRNLRGGVSK